MSKMAIKICENYRKMERELIHAGVFFHDIGKIHEIESARTFSYTDEGKLLGHLIIGCGMVEEKAGGIDSLSCERLMLIKHMILSHHGKLEFGSPKLPMIPEAYILNFLDDVDAKLNTMKSILSDVKEGEWSAFSRVLGREIYGRRREKSLRSEGADESKGKSHGKKSAGRRKQRRKSSTSELELFK
jgi:3'-5' exoribonuclease